MATAYLVGFLDVSTPPEEKGFMAPRVCAVGIYSEPEPTTSGKVFSFPIMDVRGESFGEARAELLVHVSRLVASRRYAWLGPLLEVAGHPIPRTVRP